MASATRKPKIGLALGSGSARGWAHIGVLRALDEAGIRPDIVCGTSIGALVGAAYADGDLDRLEQWVGGLTWKDVVGFLDFSLSGGVIKGDRLIEFFRSNFVDKTISELPLPFAAVATDLENGREVWLREGLLADAVRASIALPGLFAPVRHDGRWLVDGGLVNPVPVSLCRAMGADLVIAVDLNSDLLGRHLRREGPAPAGKPAKPNGLAEAVLDRLQAGIASLGIAAPGHEKGVPSVLEVMATSVNIMQVRITRSRLVGEPADVLIAPRLAHLGLMEFHRARTAIEAGRKAAIHGLVQVRELVAEDL
ncbi:MAG: patatin-like phospholipase RssA [Betaproteobacteria bacterium]|nr:patatin-like phospholipase RssA [Betaproteobacteria bacterium]